ncbi:MAG: helix-turn-helix domain-containing protein [Kangiellaceae bacterium]|nr:helix-turn-helix domain-containing protein [Kangiellaceae bacterium]
MELLTTLNIGFSIIVSVVLFVCYVFFLKSDNKSTLSIVSSALILLGIALLQFEHLNFILNRSDPLESIYYRALLFLIPPFFYFFSRFVMFPEYQLKFYSGLHFVPFAMVFFVSREIAVPVAFLIGTSYCIWLSHIIFNLRQHRKRFEIEFFFYAFFSILAIAVLIFGFSASFVDNAYFYHFYSNGIAFAFVLVTGALFIYPDLLNEITEVIKLGYSKSTLSNIDIEQNLTRLNELMHEANLYQNENLSLSLLADSMELSVHQLSELINTNFGMNFSKYIRELRIEQAKGLLINQPKASILSISMETGFKSQSNFYAAFKDLTGQSPGHFRKVSS